MVVMWESRYRNSNHIGFVVPLISGLKFETDVT